MKQQGNYIGNITYTHIGKQNSKQATDRVYNQVRNLPWRQQTPIWDQIRTLVLYPAWDHLEEIVDERAS